MQLFEAEISLKCIDFFKENMHAADDLPSANQKIFHSFGINDFFAKEEEFRAFKENISENQAVIEERNKIEYGDFQTNLRLATACVDYFLVKNESPELLIEPTCGKGNFIIAALQRLKKLKMVIGVEIYPPYVWQTKFNIIDFYLNNPTDSKPSIFIYHKSIFEFDFTQIPIDDFSDLLVLGNPPWVTNATLGSIHSNNLPSKSNFKKQDGLDALTGKGNFDIAESITLMMLNVFQKKQGILMFLVKNTVIKNIIFEQKRNNYRIGDVEKQLIDSKKEFNVSVDAALLYATLNVEPTAVCKEMDFYDKKIIREFGWINDKFVSNMDFYTKYSQLDGECCFTWRQGIKHDCASVMELDKKGENTYVNGLNQTIELENDLVYGMLKSSDLKNKPIPTPRKYTIVTQKKIGDSTDSIQALYPKTYTYLSTHKELFSKRKSIIYKNKPPFSIFGVGEYSFKPYKVAISGLYKTFFFTLVLPDQGKPVVTDDTCYFLGFDKLEAAVYTLTLLNSDVARNFLESITFSDSKRVFTKDVLMRIHLFKLANSMDESFWKERLSETNANYNLAIDFQGWKSYLKTIQPQPTGYQSTMF